LDSFSLSKDALRHKASVDVSYLRFSTRVMLPVTGDLTKTITRAVRARLPSRVPMLPPGFTYAAIQVASSLRGRKAMRLRSASNVWLVVMMVVCLVPYTFSQATLSFAQLNGTVQDTSGRIIVGASVIARNLATNQTYPATTSTSGYYFVPNLPPGQYEISVQAGGFAKSVQTGLVLTVGQTATIDVTLKVATAGESVTVTTEAPPVETSRSEISQVIDTATSENSARNSP
jgi:Carboxypeptidase regulatory-like domain